MEKSNDDSQRKRKHSPDSEAKKKGKVFGIDDEAAESGDGHSSESDENSEAGDGFIEKSDDGDSDVVSDDSDSDSDAPKKELKKLKKQKDIKLDEDDELLVQENAIEQFRNEIEATRAPPGTLLDAAASSDDDAIAPSASKTRVGYYDDDDSDLDDFLVDDEDEELLEGEDADAAAARREAAATAAREQREQRLSSQAAYANKRKSGPTYDQVQEAVSIFGEGYDDFDEEEDYDPDEEEKEEEEAGMSLRGPAAAVGSKKAMSRAAAKESKAISMLRAQFDHSQIVAMFGTEQDDEIRATDLPERFQSFNWMRDREPPDAEERANEARWVVIKLSKQLLSEQQGSREMREQSEQMLRVSLLSSVEFVLKSIHVDRLEVPFLWTYRKDYLHPSITRDMLWQILFLDEEWEVMYAKKVRLGQQLKALSDAGHSSSTDEGEYASLEREAAELTKDCELMEHSVRRAEEDEKVAMDIVEERDDDHTEDDRERVRAATAQVESAKSTLTDARARLSSVQAQLAAEKVRLERKAQFDPNTAKEVLRLFPLVRYEAMLNESTNDVELEYWSKFMEQLVRGASAAAAAAAGSNEENQTQAPGESDDEDGVQSMKRTGKSAAALKRAVKTRASLRKDVYTQCNRVHGIREFVEKLAVPVCAIGDSCTQGVRTEPPETPALGCLAAAEEVLQKHLHMVEKLRKSSSVGSSTGEADDGAIFGDEDEDATGRSIQRASLVKSADDVIQAAKTILATELCSEPSIRLAMREVFLETATVSTVPTAIGLQTINPYSPYFGLHFLVRKPLREFFIGDDRTLYIRLCEARRDGLLKVSIEPEMSMNEDGSESISAKVFMDRFNIVNHLMPSTPANLDPDIGRRRSWDAERLDVIRVCVEKVLVPGLQQEFHRELIKVGRDALVESAAKNFERMLAIGPYRSPHADFRDDIKDLLYSTPKRPSYPTVLSVYMSTEPGDPMYLAYVNKDGVLRAHDFIPREALKDRKPKIQKFMFEHRPSVIVVNAGGGQQARSLAMTIEKDILREVVQEVELENARRREQRGYDDEEVFIPYKADVLLIEDKVATIFRNSARAQKLLPDLPSYGAAAVCLARFVQEPLAEYCDMFTAPNASGEFGHELLFLDLHPQKRLLLTAREQLLRALQCKLVDTVCEVGVDLNLAVAQQHRSGMLAFVGGLGLRKADALAVGIRRSASGVATSRSELLTRKMMDKVVWTNASGFLRICDHAAVDEEDEEDSNFELLDNTRIHPECYITYNIALKMCADALDIDFSNLRTTAERNGVIRQIMWRVKEVLSKRIKKTPRWLDLWEKGRPAPNAIVQPSYDAAAFAADKAPAPVGVELPDPLFRLILDEFANDLEAQGAGLRRLQLEQIKDEIRYPWLDMRPSIKSIDTKALFTALTNETDYSLYVGLQVGCTVVEISDKSFSDANDGSGGMVRRQQRAVVKLDSGMRGTINARDVLDGFVDYESFSMADHIQVGARLSAVVVGVHKDRLQVDLSVKPSHLAMNEAQWMRVRTSDRQAERWWQSTGRDAHNLFDRHFKEEEALKMYSEHEAVTALEAEKVAMQRLSQSTGGAFLRNNSSAGVTSGSAAAASTGGAGGKQQLMRRVLHPQFANVDYKQAEERLKLEGKGAGAMLVRPSSKGSEYLTITWAFQDGWYSHISVEERNKRPGDLGLGSELYVDGWSEPFSDLDHLFVMYIEPMNDLVAAMVKHKNFHSGSSEDVLETMKTELQEQPTRIPYYLCFDHASPGKFNLIWMSTNPNSTVPVKKQRISVQPNGFKLVGSKPGEGVFSRPTELINWFKTTMQQQQQLAAEAAAKQKNVHSAVAAANQLHQQQQQPQQQPRRSRFDSAPAPAAAAIAAPYGVPPGGYGNYGGPPIIPVGAHGGFSTGAAAQMPLPPPPPVFHAPQQQQPPAHHQSRFSNAAPSYDHHYY